MKALTKTDYLPNLREIEGFFDDHKDKYNDQLLREHAREDAKSNLPRINSEEAAPFEQELTHATADLASKVASRFRGALEMLDAKIKAEGQRLRSEHKDAIESVNSLHQIDIEASENAFGLTDAHKQLEVADKRFDQLYTKIGRTPVFYVPHWVYLVFATAIFLGEIPLNALVFQIFGENQVMTWVMAFIIGLSIPLTAHFIGIKLREHGDGFSLPNALKGLAAFAIITMALYGLSLMRQTYLGEFKQELGLTDTLVESSFLFFWLNIAVFCAAIFVSYLAHDSIEGYQDAADFASRSRRSVAKQEKNRVKQLIKASKARALALSKVNEKFRDRRLELMMLKGIYDQVLKEGQEFERRCLKLLGRQLSVYRQENLRNRTETETPKSFADTPKFELVLSELKEKLDNEEQETHTNA